MASNQTRLMLSTYTKQCMTTRADYSANILRALSEFEDKRLKEEDHIEKWLLQFSDENQDLILQETSRLIENFYFSEDTITSELLSVCNKGLDKSRDYTLIPHQRSGSSREYFTSLFERKAGENGIRLNEESHNYLLIDDCIFSGNTMIKELESWLEINYREGITITIVVHAYYKQGAEYLKYRIERARLEGNYQFMGTILSQKAFNESNLMRPRAESHESKEYFDLLSNYKNESQSRKPLIPPRVSDVVNDPLFSSPSVRNIFEDEMLTYGKRLVETTGYPIQNSLRPMGYDARLSYGFGAFYANFRNISNNCPLAFWYKSEGFYPLIDRKVR